MAGEVVVRSFNVKTRLGKIYKIIEYEARISPGSPEKPAAGKRLATSGGLHVNYLDDQTFQIVETDEIAKTFK